MSHERLLIDPSSIRLLPSFDLKFDPMASRIFIEAPKPTLGDSRGDIDRVVAALRKTLPAGEAAANIHVPLTLVQRISRVLRDASFRVTLILTRCDVGYELIDVRADSPRCFGAAIDIGTTVVSLYLVDLEAGEIIAKAAAENPQIAHGEDILTRIHYCRKSGGLDELRQLILDCINKSILEVARAAGVRPADLYAGCIAGNPTMMHLLLGVDPYFLCREPYVPAFNLPLQYKAKELRMSLVPEAPVYLFPSVGSYFGGDVVAGIVASGMHRQERTSILVDVGTNAEIVVGNRDWLVACAGAAGPALESGGAKAGMRAIGGAIERVRIDRRTLEPEYEVIGGGPPKGICGSGFIDLAAQLFLAGALDPRGRFTEDFRSARIRECGHMKGYALALKERGESEGDIIIDEADIDNLLRAKGAMYTALLVITERLGVRFDEVQTFFVAGSFGEHIDPRHAVALGMLPDIALERYTVLGNSAGLGACLLLVSSALRGTIDDVRKKAAYIQLTADAEFMSRLPEAFVIPHAKQELFPSAAGHRRR